MMIVEVTEDNVEEYREMIPDEYLQDIEREYCNVLVGIDSESHDLIAAVFWEVKNVERERIDNAAEIRWFFAEGKEQAGELLDAFDEKNSYDEVKGAYFELETLRDQEIAALKERGFSIKQTQGIDVYVSVEEIMKLDIVKKRPPEYIMSISDVSSFQFKAGIMNSVFHERYGLLDDLPFLPISWYDPDISSCVLTDDRVTGILLVHKMKPGLRRVELLFSEKLDAAINVLNMLRFSIQAAGRLLEPEELFLIRRHNRTVIELVKKLFPGKKGDRIYRGIRSKR